MTTCKNCDNQFEGKYCNNCRQPANTHRISWHEILHHLPHAIFHADKGLFYTMKELALRPGITIKNYLNGKRIDHFNPFLFLILIGGLASLLYISLHENPLNKEIQLEKLKAHSGTLAYKYFALIGVLFILLLSISDYFFHIKKKYVLPEIIVSNTFQVGQVMVFTIIALPFLLLQNYIAQQTGVYIESRVFFRTAVVGYLFFVRFQLYEAKADYWLILKIILQLVFVYVLYDFLITRLIIYGINQM